MIPKIIHYCWFGGKPIPKNINKYIETWSARCPDYKIQCWNEENFDVGKYPFTNSAYKAQAWAFVSDFARLEVIYKYGGIYLDTDVELLKSLDSLLKYDFFIGSELAEQYITTGLGFGAIKNHPIVLEMLKKYENLNFDSTKKGDYACPKLNTYAVESFGFKYSNNIQLIKNDLVLPAEYMDPMAPGVETNLLSDKTISIHHYTASWYPKKYRYKRFVINLIGQNKINKIKKFFYPRKRK